MINWFVLMIYLGGVFTEWSKNRGFWSRISWPIKLGEAVYFRVKVWKND
jgi:hypothetical protein